MRWNRFHPEFREPFDPCPVKEPEVLAIVGHEQPVVAGGGSHVFVVTRPSAMDAPGNDRAMSMSFQERSELLGHILVEVETRHRSATSFTLPERLIIQQQLGVEERPQPLVVGHRRPHCLLRLVVGDRRARDTVTTS